MNSLQIFSNQKFGQVRTTEVDGKIYFVAYDVASALGYARPNNAINQHCKGALKRGIPTNGGLQEMNVIPEGDIYRLVIKSELPGAEEFESWIFDDVIPSIRKHGAYMTPATIEKALSNPDFIIELATKLKEHQAIIADQQKQLAYKNEVIKGVTDDIDIYTKRNILNKVVRYKGANFAERWNELYSRYKEVYSVDLKARCEGYNIRQTKKKDQLTTVKYAEKFGHLECLYKIALKLYETDISEILKHLQKIA